MANFVAMLLFTLPSLRRNNSKSRRNAKSISSNRVFSDLNSDRRESRERCLDAEPYLPSVSSRSMVCFRYSPTEQFNRLLFCSKRFSKVTGISIISKRWIFFSYSFTLAVIWNWILSLSGQSSVTFCASASQCLSATETPNPTAFLRLPWKNKRHNGEVEFL